MKITVKAKITAGYHPGLNANIVEGEEYIIEETQFAVQLFHKPAPEWLAPWERGLDHVPTEKETGVMVAETKPGGTKK